MKALKKEDILVVIPARGGSKGIPKKNIKPLNGKPLIHYTIEAAQQIFGNNQIIVSTDDEYIKNIAEGKGLNVPFLRPEGLASDHASTHNVLIHAIEHVESNDWYPKVLVLLQPTSPFRNAVHIKEALDLFDDDTDAIVSVKETNSNPYYVLMEENMNGFLERSKEGNFTRRQDCPKVWELNGAIYIISVDELKNRPLTSMQKVKKYIMDEMSSHDIDTSLDWITAESIINHTSLSN
jgi:N-acylneuraminate cytidylyltransferase